MFDMIEKSLVVYCDQKCGSTLFGPFICFNTIILSEYSKRFMHKQ